MTTYIIQYKKNGVWSNYSASDWKAIEFLDKLAAIAVAQDLSCYHELMPSSIFDWQIVDSHGEIFPVPVQNDLTTA